jgi:hypothetical protein
MPFTYSEQSELVEIIQDMDQNDLYRVLYIIEKDACPKTVTKNETIFDITKLSERTVEKLRKTLLSDE